MSTTLVTSLERVRKSGEGRSLERRRRVTSTRLSPTAYRIVCGIGLAQQRLPLGRGSDRVAGPHRRALAGSARPVRPLGDGGQPVLPLAPQGVWDRVLQALQADADARGELDWLLHFVDGSVVRPHQHAAGARRWQADGDPGHRRAAQRGADAACAHGGRRGQAAAGPGPGSARPRSQATRATASPACGATCAAAASGR